MLLRSASNHGGVAVRKLALLSTLLIMLGSTNQLMMGAAAAQSQPPSGRTIVDAVVLVWPTQSGEGQSTCIRLDDGQLRITARLTDQSLPEGVEFGFRRYLVS